MESNTNTPGSLLQLVEFYKTKSENEERLFHKKLEEKVYPLQDKVKSQEEELDFYKQIEAQRAEQVQQIDTLQASLKAAMHSSRLAKQTPNTKEVLQNEIDDCKKQHKEQLAAVRMAADLEKAQLQQSHQEEMETLRSETQAAQDKLKGVTRSCDETIKYLKRKLEDVTEKYEKEVHKLKAECKNAEPETLRLRDEVLQLKTKIRRCDQTDKIESLQQKLQEKEDIIEKEAARLSNIVEKSKKWKQAADKQKETTALLEKEVQENEEMKATIEMLNTQLEKERAKNQTLEDKKSELFYKNYELSQEIGSLNKTVTHQNQKYKNLREIVDRPKLEAAHYKRELSDCIAAFEKAFPHAAHNGETSFREFRAKFLNIKKKYFHGGRCPTVNVNEKELINILNQKLEESEIRIKDLSKEVKWQMKQRDTDEHKRCLSEWKIKSRLSEAANAAFKNAHDLKQENDHLKSEVIDLQLELKKEKERRCHCETPRSSTPPSKTAVLEVGPDNVKCCLPHSLPLLKTQPRPL